MWNVALLHYEPFFVSILSKAPAHRSYRHGDAHGSRRRERALTDLLAAAGGSCNIPLLLILTASRQTPPLKSWIRVHIGDSSHQQELFRGVEFPKIGLNYESGRCRRRYMRMRMYPYDGEVHVLPVSKNNHQLRHIS